MNGLRILVRGGGDLASGVVLRLHRAGWQVLVAELDHPRVVRRYVSFARAVYDGEIRVEEARARLVSGLEEAGRAFAEGVVPVMVDPALDCLAGFAPHVLVDGRMTKRPPEIGMEAAALVIGLGPGFTAGQDCHAVVETNRGHDMGRVIWRGQAQADTGVPERVAGYRVERVLRSPAEGRLDVLADIGRHVAQGETLARIAGEEVLAPFDGVIRGMAQDGLWVQVGEKIGDLDPRGDERLCWLVSDKALAVAGGVLEAILMWQTRRGE